MNIEQQRRENLRKWSGMFGIPHKEKTYILQLLDDESKFGDLAARHVESTCGMPNGYLDIGTTARRTQIPQELVNEADQVMELIGLFKKMPSEKRAELLRFARTMQKPSSHPV